MAVSGSGSIPITMGKLKVEFDEVQWQRLLAQSKENADLVAAATLKGLQAVADAISGLMVPAAQITGGGTLTAQQP